MLRSHQILLKKPQNLSVLTSGLCTKVNTLRRSNELNEVNIVGTIINSQTLKSGTKALTVKTYHSPEKYNTHIIRSNVKANFANGQRIVVNGSLRSVNETFSDDKTITVTTVQAMKIYSLENNSARPAVDKNHVEIVANIASNIKSKEKDCSFNVATNLIRKNEQGEDVNVVNYHHVVAYDNELREYIKNHLSKSDRVYVSGKIGHMVHSNDDGKKAYSGFIVADSINKVSRRAKSQLESPENNELKQEN